MAKNQEIMEINLRKNTNASSKGYGKYYGFVEFKGTLTTRALAEHMASHGSLWTRDLVEGVQNQLKVCLPLLIAKAELEDTIINRKRFASLVGSLFILYICSKLFVKRKQTWIITILTPPPAPPLQGRGEQ